MTSTPCGRCGGLAPLGATFCPFCGATLRSTLPGVSPFQTSTPGVYAPAPPSTALPPPINPSGFVPYGSASAPPIPPAPVPPSNASAGADLPALAFVWWASLILIGADAVSYLVFVIPTSSTLPTTGSPLAAYVHFDTTFYLLAFGSAGIEFVYVLLLRGAFVRVAAVDPRFVTPRKLAFVLLVGSVISVVGLAVFIHVLQGLGDCTVTASGKFAGNCSALGNLELAELILFPGAVMLVVGYVGCLLGIWRLGARYQETSFKVGAVLLLIPLVSVAGAVLLLIAAGNARAKIAGPGAPRSSIPSLR